MTTSRKSIEITVQPWFKDHSFDGRVILPAVETMNLLAAEVACFFPDIDVRIMEQARFARFLELPPERTKVEALVECSRQENGSIRAKLLSRITLNTMTRLIEHGEIWFSPAATPAPPNPVNALRDQDEFVTRVTAERIYKELVPFGPAYQTLTGTLVLSEQGAWGTLKAPMLPETGIWERIGSPFPLDGAMHAACVHGQQYVDFVPFPVGFTKRIISKPTRPGYDYIAKIVSVSRTADELIFDLVICDSDGKVYESVTGVRMRNVGKTIKNSY